MGDYKRQEFGAINFDDGKTKPLWEEYAQLKYNVSDNHYATNLKKHFNVQKSEQALNRIKEKIKQEIIVSDESPDNNVRYVAMANFKKTNE